jgi:uncharacterized membrane protein YraQ (UPF0718 family)
MSLLGWKFTVLHVVVGMAVGILGGLFLDAIKAERWLQSFADEAFKKGQSKALGESQASAEESSSLTVRERHQFDKTEAFEIFGRVWRQVIIGVGLYTALHGFVPDGW